MNIIDNRPEGAAASREPWRISRREVIAVGGATLVATLFAEPLSAQTPGATTKNGGTKPVYVPQANDAVSHSVAENLFWTDILMEHAVFYAMLMPGPELAAQRARAEKFKANFAGQFEKAKASKLDKGSYAAFNSATIEMVKPFVDFKREMQAAQESGKMR